MTAGDIIMELEKTYPRHLAESWDNPGLIAGRRDKEVQRIYLALDATDKVIAEAKAARADLLITHPPMLMGAIKQINTDDFTGRRLVELLRSDIAYYAIHTNYDVVTMAPLAGRMLGLTESEVLAVTCEDEQGVKGFGEVGRLPHAMTLEACAEYVKRIFGLNSVKIFGDMKQRVERAAVLPGSGKSMVAEAAAKGVEVLISGDFGHHDGIDAVMQGVNVIDAGHYGLEHIFIGQMQEYLQETFPDMVVLQEMIVNPFTVI